MRSHWLGLVVAFSVAAAMAADLPTMKPGLWESTVARQGGPGGTAGDRHTTKMCLDTQFQKDMIGMGMGMMKSMCTRRDTRIEGSKVYGSSVCKMGTSTMTSSSVTTLMGDSGYHTDVKTSFNPPLMGKAESATAVDGKWLGPCQAGMQPGDMIMPDGRVVNMRSLAAGAKPQ